VTRPIALVILVLILLTLFGTHLMRLIQVVAGRRYGGTTP
jgi:hypothetical protein